MQKLLPYLVALSAFALIPFMAQAAESGPSDVEKLQTAREQHVMISPTELDAGINQYLNERHLTAAQASAVLSILGLNEDVLRQHILAQVSWEKTAH